MIGGADGGLVCEWSAWFVEGVWYGIAGGKLLIEKHILFPWNINVSLKLTLLLLGRVEVRITSTDETTHDRMLRSSTGH